MFASVLVALQPPTPAQAISASEFQPGYIIDDTEFFNGTAMTETEIQKFLVSKGSGLATYRSTMRDVPAQGTRCTAFTGGENLLASTLIYRTQVACNVSAKVILVTLQKEQGLINKSNPAAWELTIAMGFGCPDGQDCDKYYFGFGNQVYWAALQFQTYKQFPNSFNFRPGTFQVLYHPSGAAKCGTRTVKIANYATAALYNYTPYTPTSSALAAWPGASSDTCASYGNRNFWFFYYTWFGNPTTITPSASVDRLDGSDRYVVSANVSKASFPTTAPVVYIATGRNFPDALSAGPAAAKLGGPLLLVNGGQMPPTVKEELVRLQPGRVVVAGGPASIPESLLAEITTLVPGATVERDSGADRYEVSRNVARAHFDEGSDVAYLATGSTFPDALSASAAAGAVGAPVILVNGGQAQLDAETQKLLVDLGVSKVVIAGGSASVSSGVESGLRSTAGVTEVVRHGGSDRFVVSGALNRAAFDSAETVYLASGLTFPDALSGSPVAGLSGSPLYVIGRGCIPKYVLQDIVDLGAKRVVVLGGTGSVYASITSYPNC